MAFRACQASRPAGGKQRVTRTVEREGVQRFECRYIHHDFCCIRALSHHTITGTAAHWHRNRRSGRVRIGQEHEYSA